MDARSLSEQGPSTVPLQGPPVARIGPDSRRLSPAATGLSISWLQTADGSTVLSQGPRGRPDSASVILCGAIGGRALPGAPYSPLSASTSDVVKVGIDAIESQQREESPAPVITQHPLLMGSAPVPPATAFCDPGEWQKQFKELRSGTVKSKDLIAVGHTAKSDLRTKSAVRAACCVRVLPSLDAIKAALRQPGAERRRQQRYDMWESASMAEGRGEGVMGQSNTSCRTSQSNSRSRAISRSPGHVGLANGTTGDPTAAASTTPMVRLYMPPPAIWAIGGVNDGDISIYEAFSGRPLMRIRDPKANVPAVSLLHAPFRGFMNRQLHVIPAKEPRELLRLKSAQLIETDWVWIGFSDGSIRLVPANPITVRAYDRAERQSKGELADLVYELPKYHSASIVSIVRSPCHRDDDGADLSTLNRLSTAVEYATAAGAEDSDKSREHLSLMCTASVDSSIVVWDVRRIYQTLEAMRAARKEALSGTSAAVTAGGRGGGGGCLASSGAAARMSTSGRAHTTPYSAGSVYSNETITIEGVSPPFTVRSCCTMVKVRPLMRLKGGVAGLRSLQWVSTLVTTDGFTDRRRAAELTRDAEEPSAPQLVRDLKPLQTLTRYERRERHRRALRLSNADMCEVEEELARLMPPVMQEPLQSLRVNLIVAGDGVGTVHFWNLDEELARKQTDPLNERASSVADSGRSGGGGSRQRSPHYTAHTAGSESPGRGSVGACSAVSPSVQLSALDGPVSARAVAVFQHDKPVSASARPSGGRSGSVLAAQPRRKKTVGAASSKAAHGGVSATPKRSTGVAGNATGRGTTPGRSKATVKTPAKASVPRGAGGGTATAGKRSIVSPARAGSGPEAPPMSRLQLLAAQREDPTLPMREMNRAMQSPRRPSVGGHGGCMGTGATSGRRASSTAQASARTVHRQRTARKAEPRPRGPSMAAATTANAEDPCEDMGPRMSALAVTSPSASSRPSPARALSEAATVISPRRRRSPSVQAAHIGTDTTAADGGSTPAVRASPARRGASAESTSAQRALNEYLSRASRCRIEFTDGVAITGMAIDAPPKLSATLRRAPNAVERPISLLEEPTPAEVEQRLLRNSFDPLTEERALFFLFQHLQLYLAVEGTVLNLRCAPEWRLPDADGRDLFMQRGEREGAELVAEQQLSRETSVEGSVELTPAFGIRLRKLVLEMHPQPVTELFLDKGRGHVWVARNDGLVSLFSTHTKKVVTRVPHPCADLALGPPPQKEWRQQQRELLASYAAGGPAPRLELHRECRGYEQAAHVSGLVPFGRRTQVSLLVTARNTTNRGSRNSQLHGYSGWGAPSSTASQALDANGDHAVRGLQCTLTPRSLGSPLTRLSSRLGAAAAGLAESLSGTLDDHFARRPDGMAAVVLDGCSDLSAHAVRRETRLATLLHRLLWCRCNADAVRRGRKATYEAACDAVGARVHYVMRELGAYATLSLLHKSYDLWREHARHYRRPYCMRSQRAARLARSRGAAAAMARTLTLQLVADAFRRWFGWCSRRHRGMEAARLARLIAPLEADRVRKQWHLTARLASHLLETQQRLEVFAEWRAWAAAEAAAKAEQGGCAFSPRATHWDAPHGNSSPWPSNAVPTPSDSPSAEAPTPSQQQGQHHEQRDHGASEGHVPSLEGSPRAASPLVRTFTRVHRTSASPPPGTARRGGHEPVADDGEYGSEYSISRNSSGDETDEAEERDTRGDGDVATSPSKLRVLVRRLVIMLRMLYRARPAMMQFRESHSTPDTVLDESWMSIVESAEGAAATDDDPGRRLAVFSYGLLTLLQGLLSSADDVLPHLSERSVAEEVTSMLSGIQLCMDYVAADAEDALAALRKTDAESAEGDAIGQRSAHERDPLLSTPEQLYMQVVTAYARRAVLDEENAQAMAQITAERESLEAFLVFIEDEQLEARNRVSTSLH